METSKCPKCGSEPRRDAVLPTATNPRRFLCGSYYLGVDDFSQSSLCLKSEKEAAERERDELCELFDCQPADLKREVVESRELWDGLLRVSQEKLAAATSRAEALATGIEFIHSGRIVLSQDNGEWLAGKWGAVFGTKIVTGCETAAEAVLAAMLQPKEAVDGK